MRKEEIVNKSIFNFDLKAICCETTKNINNKTLGNITNLVFCNIFLLILKFILFVGGKTFFFSLKIEVNRPIDIYIYILKHIYRK